MSVDDRLRIGLAANTGHIRPDLNHELAVVRRRAGRRRRTRWAALGVGVVTATAVGVIWLPDAIDSVNGMNGTTNPATEQTTPVPTPADRDDDGSLNAGTYAVPFLGSGSDSLPRAVIELPSDEFIFGDFVTSGSGPTLRTFGFWTVDAVAADPCERPGGGYVDPGPTVAALAAALAAQPSKGTTEPQAVTLGGYDGLYLETSVPTDIDVEGCTDGYLVSWRDDNHNFRTHTAPGEVERLWVLDAAGERLVVSASYNAGVSADQIAELDRIVESITFIDTAS